MKKIFDAEYAIVGRLGSYVAKELLKGNEVIVINSEKAIISGDRKGIVEKIIRWRAKGLSSQKGPKVSKIPEKLLKRMFRGMLPWEKAKGREAYKRLKCFAGSEGIKNAIKLKMKKPTKYISINEIVKLLG